MDREKLKYIVFFGEENFGEYELVLKKSGEGISGILKSTNSKKSQKNKIRR
jgi:hypothetical protein